MSERQYTDQQKEIYRKIDNVLSQNQTLKTLGVSGWTLFGYSFINSNDNNDITNFEIESLANKACDHQQARLDHSKFVITLKEKLHDEIQLAEKIVKEKEIPDEQLNELNVYCYQISMMATYITNVSVLAELTKNVILNVMQNESDLRIVGALILYYFVGFTEDDISSTFVVHPKTVKRWLKQALIDDLSSDLQKQIIDLYHD